MKNLKRIIALLLAIFLISLYGFTLIISIIGGPQQDSMLKACIYATVIIPILMWTYNLIYRILKREPTPEEKEETSESVSEKEKTE